MNLEDRGDVVIHGEVAKPASYPYADNMTLEDLIIQAGGLREAASVVRVDVSRRIRNPYSTVDNDTIGRTYTFSLKEGFVVDGTPGLCFNRTMRFMYAAARAIRPNRMYQLKVKSCSKAPTP